MGSPRVAGSKKNARRRRAWIAFQDKSGVSQRPPIRRTWAPRGETPALTHRFNWKKFSVSAVVAYRWDGKRSGLFFRMRPGSYNEESLIDFLEDLRREMRGRRVILIWDGLPSHRSRLMKDYLAAKRRWLTVVSLPGYAPDLNPVETLWNSIKGTELANRCADELGELASAVKSGMRRVWRHRSLAFSFLDHAGLFF